jgi:hypothetical protein
MPETEPEDDVTASVARWLERVVVGLNLCPFAGKALLDQQVRLLPSIAETPEQLLRDLEQELIFLGDNDNWETSLLIHPQVLTDFYDYNQFLDLADGLVQQMDLEGVFQIASFHPHYQFAKTDPEDAENYSNRSPYPMLHILREASVERAVTEYTEVEDIPMRNLETLNLLGKEKLQAMWQACFDE